MIVTRVRMSFDEIKKYVKDQMKSLFERCFNESFWLGLRPLSILMIVGIYVLSVIVIIFWCLLVILILEENRSARCWIRLQLVWEIFMLNINHVFLYLT